MLISGGRRRRPLVSFVALPRGSDRRSAGLAIPRRRPYLSVALALLVVLIAGCSIAIVAPYDPITDERLTDLHRKVTVVLDHLSGLTHEEARPALASVKGDIRTLQARNKARPLNELTTAQLDLIASTWSKLDALVGLGPMTPREVEVMRKTLDVEIGAAIALEIDKRRLR
jgi:hypothetical protein